MPGSKNVGQNIVENTAAHPEWSRKQVLAVSLSQAREAGSKKVKAPPSVIKKSKRSKGKK